MFFGWLEPPYSLRLSRLFMLGKSSPKFGANAWGTSRPPILRRVTRGFFWAGEFSWNQGTSISDHLQHEKERPGREKLSVFPLETVRNLIHSKAQSGHYPQNQGTFFQFLKNGGGDKFFLFKINSFWHFGWKTSWVYSTRLYIYEVLRFS